MKMRLPFRPDTYSIAGIVLLLFSAIETLMLFFGPIAVSKVGFLDMPFFILALGASLLGVGLLIFRLREPADAGRREKEEKFFFFTELLTVYALLLFLFSYIFAANAGLDYVQRFIETGGELRLAMDTGTERAIVSARLLPILLPVFFFHIHLAVRLRKFGLLLTFLAAGLTTLSFPSMVKLEGFGFLGWVSLAPLVYLLWKSSYGKIIFYGVSYGVLATLMSNYWLGTFSLVSLMAVLLIFLFFYLVFMIPFGGVIVLARRSSPLVRMVLTASMWTVFELFRSSGFLGYPWVLIAHSQYANVPLIQISELTAVWGVTFVVVLVNAALAELLRYLEDSAYPGGEKTAKRLKRAVLFAAGVAAAAHVYGGYILLAENRYPEADTFASVALIQQNSDPRKHDYDRTFESLKTLTDRALEEEPDLVAWSETAFVPNIRRWGEEDPERYSLARLVREFRDYQESASAWLLTGNDDYKRVFDGEEKEVDRLNYNAAVLFSDNGRRVETYHKIKLVPFTEHFPYEEQLPFVYKTLQDFDVYFWEPGEERTVFQHPKFTFSTPICFEDVFPNEIRQFVLSGSEVILNLTNDYWSLTEVQAQQHFAGSIFRSVENRRPLLRSTASGVTSHVDPYGRVIETRPQYSEQYMIAEFPVAHDPLFTLYTRLGDWFPRAAALLVVLLTAAGLKSSLFLRFSGLFRFFKRKP
ncbi:MAG: apolipoprotein N-acyltransferase [Sediminispirochaetaceae bacterium]